MKRIIDFRQDINILWGEEKEDGVPF